MYQSYLLSINEDKGFSIEEDNIKSELQVDKMLSTND